MSDWMSDYENKKDDRREEQINIDLRSLKEQYEETLPGEDDKRDLILLRAIVNLYETLKMERCAYDEKDYKRKKEELEALEGKVMKEKHDQSDDSESWNDYKEEELLEEEMEDDDER